MAGFRAFLMGLLALLACGCASAPPTAEALAANDPYEATNRQTFALNAKLDKYFVIPTVGIYFTLVPDAGRRIVHHFLDNISLPTTFLNDVLQGETHRAGQTLSRLAVNATLGLGGLFDPATGFHMPNHSEDFGQTLAVWGLGEGPYLVLPLLGPDPPRDAFGQAADIALDPTSYIHIHNHVMWVGVREYFTLLDLRGQTYETVQGIERGSVDYYASMRSFYRQYRNNEIRNGRTDLKDVPDL